MLKLIRLSHKMLRKVPIIVILGSTGTGKTKLSLQLAQKFGGEIISADSMQVYKGLDIVTAKATPAEQAVAPHHLLDIVSPGKAFTVVDFRDAALPVIERLLDESKVPIVVGGTNYYIESLLWKVLVQPPVTSGVKRKWTETDRFDRIYQRLRHSADANSTENPSSTTDQLNQLDSKRLHEFLTEVDPTTASRLHPNNRRKILRALEVYESAGTPMSQIIDEQRSEPGGSCLGGGLRYDHIIIFWLQCEQDILNERLDKRIEGMIGEGLLTEIRGFYDSLGSTKDYTKGILQTIGFKEFIPYLEKYKADEDERLKEFMVTKTVDIEVPASMDLLRACLAELQLVTKRYSKKQLKWIGNRFLASTDRTVPPLYGLDTSNPINWQEDVYHPAVDVVQKYMDGEEPTLKPLERKENVRAGLNENVTNICKVCDRHFIGEFQWNIHLKSNKHKRAAYKRGKEADKDGCSVLEAISEEK